MPRLNSAEQFHEAPAPTPVATGKPLVWLLMGGRRGDNNQLLALADALGWPFEAKQLQYNELRRIPGLRNGLWSVRAQSRRLIRPPWPDLVICTGYASVPVARFIRERTGGRAKLVHVSNPRRQLNDFDLQITTPQYSRGAVANLLELPFPVGNPAKTARPVFAELAWLRDFPRPRRLIAVGGPARHWELDDAALTEAIATVRRKEPTGSIIAATSPRTRHSTRELLAGLMVRPAEAVVADFPRFATLLAQCDEIYVTADSVSMISEAVLTGSPVGLIPIKRSRKGRLVEAVYERPTGRAAFPAFRNFWAMLEREQLVGTVELPVASQVCDTVECAAAAVRAVVGEGEAVDEERRERTAAYLGPPRRSRWRQQSGDRPRRSPEAAVRDQTARV